MDRFGLAVCAALSSGEPVPGWAREALSTLPKLMSASDRRASAVERACTDAVEVAVLSSHVGEEFSGSVVDQTSKNRPIVQILVPAVLALANGEATPGDDVRVRVAAVDVETSRIDLDIIARQA